MRTHSSRRLLLTGSALLLVVAVAVAPAAPASANGASATITPVLGGLAAPRGIAFDGRGAMYVSESGVAGAGPAGLTHTGKVTKYPRGSTTPVWSTAFNSIYASEQEGAPPDVLGPEGISAVGNGCFTHSQGRRNGCQLKLIMSLSRKGVVAETGGAVTDDQAGQLYRIDGATGRIRSAVDFGDFQYDFTDANKALFPDDFPDSNPYGVLVMRDHWTGEIRTFVADAGANTISEVMRDGSIRIVAFIPNESTPPFRDATPTCIAQGPDGYLYVGTLHLVANEIVPGTDNLSDVWRVNPNATFPTAPTVWASGLSTVTACTFDRAGNFWATEMFKGGFDATPPGDVVRIPFASPTTQTHLGFGQLPVPGGIAQGPDGAMYVTVGSSAPGVSGAVVRLSLG